MSPSASLDNPNQTAAMGGLKALGVRIEKLIWLPFAISHGQANEDLVEMIEQYVDADADILRQWPLLGELYRRDSDFDIDDFIEAMSTSEQSGFVGFVARPSHRHYEGEPHPVINWGVSRHVWIFGDTMDELIVRATAWAQERADDEIARRLPAPPLGSEFA